MSVTKYLDLDFVHIRGEIGDNDLVSGLRHRGGCSNHFRSSRILSSSTGSCVCGVAQHLGFCSSTATKSARVLRASGNDLNED